MVEMAILMPLLAVILFGVIEFGIAFQRWQVVSAAAREGARSAVLADCDAGQAEAVITGVINGFVDAAGMAPGDVDILIDNACGETGSHATVTVRHGFEFPVLANFIPPLADGMSLRGASVMRNE